MDVSEERYESDGNRPTFIAAMMLSLQSVVGWLTRFLTLTEDERLAAAIYVGGDGRGR